MAKSEEYVQKNMRAEEMAKKRIVHAEEMAKKCTVRAVKKKAKKRTKKNMRAEEMAKKRIVHAEEMAKKCTVRAVKKGEETHVDSAGIRTCPGWHRWCQLWSRPDSCDGCRVDAVVCDRCDSDDHDRWGVCGRDPASQEGQQWTIGLQR